MKTIGRIHASHHDRLLNVVKAEFADRRLALGLTEELLSHETYDYEFCSRLITHARDKAISWELRRLATLMLEHQILKLNPIDLDDFALILTKLNLKRGAGLDWEVIDSVLKEGYSTTEPLYFIAEFCRRLKRLDRVHSGIRGRRTSDLAISEFIKVSRRDCKLSLARYLFAPEDIAAEILKQLQVTQGLQDLDLSEPEFVQDELFRALNELPEFEAQILKLLCESANIYWVAEATPSRINSLVEYPAKTVVLVIKPPGSDLEFEIKRAGRKGQNSLGVVYARNGYTVPPSHRLDGGSMQWLLRYECHSASRLARIYRLVHQAAAPVPSYVSRSTIYTIPSRDHEAQTLMYFNEPDLFGQGFGEMRLALKESVAAFVHEDGTNLPNDAGGLGLTGHFISHVAPAQAILCGTTSFRLDKLAAYLSPIGPEKYFGEGLGVIFTRHDARRLADELLEESLGEYHPPRVRFRTYEQYVNAAVRVPENRERANRVYLSLVKQLAKFWGTLLAIGAYTRGESFVGRNVGLKSVWLDGEWQVKIIFMDHDAVVIPGPGDGQFYPKGALPNIELDERYIWGRSNPQRFATSELGYLQSIYRINTDIQAEGDTLSRAVLKASYRKTQHALLTNPDLKTLFSKVFIDRLLVWDTLVGGYFQMNGDKSANANLKRKLKRLLRAKGYRKDSFDSYMGTIEKHRDFLARYCNLFSRETEV